MARCGASGESRNDADGRIWPTIVLEARLRHDGRFCALAELRYALLMVSQTTAKSMPCQQTRKIGQMDTNDRDTL